jgi:4,5-DOPA dioxygenase extradiol
VSGATGATPSRTDVLVDGYAYGSLSMTAYTLDLACQPPQQTANPSTPVPQEAPPDGSNI